MENLDVTVLCQPRDWRSLGKKALLATLVRTWDYENNKAKMDPGWSVVPRARMG